MKKKGRKNTKVLPASRIFKNNLFCLLGLFRGIRYWHNVLIVRRGYLSVYLRVW